MSDWYPNLSLQIKFHPTVLQVSSRFHQLFTFKLFNWTNLRYSINMWSCHNMCLTKHFQQNGFSFFVAFIRWQHNCGTTVTASLAFPFPFHIPSFCVLCCVALVDIQRFPVFSEFTLVRSNKFCACKSSCIHTNLFVHAHVASFFPQPKLRVFFNLSILFSTCVLHHIFQCMFQTIWSEFEMLMLSIPCLLYLYFIQVPNCNILFCHSGYKWSFILTNFV